MLLDWLDNNLYPLDPDLIELAAQAPASLGRDATGASVDDPALFIKCTEVATTGHVAGTKFQIDAARFKYPSPDLIYQRIVAEEGKVARSTAWDNPGAYHIDETAERASRKGVEIGKPGYIHFTLIIRLSRQTSQSISYEQNDLRRCGNSQLLDKR
jgi:hypothetical protein